MATQIEVEFKKVYKALGKDVPRAELLALITYHEEVKRTNSLMLNTYNWHDAMINIISCILDEENKVRNSSLKKS